MSSTRVTGTPVLVYLVVLLASSGGGRAAPNARESEKRFCCYRESVEVMRRVISLPRWAIAYGVYVSIEK